MFQLFPSLLRIKSKILIMTEKAPHHLASTNSYLIALPPSTEHWPPNFQFLKTPGNYPKTLTHAVTASRKTFLLSSTPAPVH